MAPNQSTKHHPYIVNAGQKLEWLPSDTKERYQENLINKKDELKKNNWLSTKIDYKFNDDGFRSDSFFKKKGGIMFLGCSFTFGIGVPQEHTFAALVSKKFNQTCFNFGLPAASNDTAFRLADIWIPILEPFLVVLLSPLPMRFELLGYDVKDKENASKFVTTMEQLTHEVDKTLWIENEENGTINRRKNKLAIQKICDQKRINFLSEDSENFPMVDYGRDLLHPGIKSHKVFATELIKRLS